jgi:hypothetical protein
MITYPEFSLSLNDAAFNINAEMVHVCSLYYARDAVPAGKVKSKRNVASEIQWICATVVSM